MDFRSLRAPLLTSAFDPLAWAEAQGFVGQACPLVTDIPGTVCRPDVRAAGEPPRWPSFEAQAGAQRYLTTPANSSMWNMSGLGSVNGLRGMGVGSAIDDVLRTVEREVSSEAEAAVERAAMKWILPPVAAAIAISLLALGVALSAHKRNARASNRRRSRRRNRR